jgi:hypothetical protein
VGGGDGPSVAVADGVACAGGEGAVVAAGHHHIPDVDVAVGRSGGRPVRAPVVSRVFWMWWLMRVACSLVVVVIANDRPFACASTHRSPDRVQVLVEAARLDASVPPVLRQQPGHRGGGGVMLRLPMVG